MIAASALLAILLSVGVMVPLAIGLPLVLLVACASKRLRRRMPRVFAIAPVPALLAALFDADAGSFELGNDLFSLSFSLDAPGAMLLGAAAFLWIISGIYAARFLRDQPEPDGFIVCWLMTLTGCVGVFLAADLIGFYFLLAVLSVGASGLVLQGQGPDAMRAGALYLALALLAEAFLLAGLILMANATPDGSLLIRDAVAALPDSPTRDLTVTLLLIGLGMKAGLVPLHFWMPLAYTAAPIPAAAVMSGAVVKASVIALVRFLPLDVAMPDFGHALAVVGLFGALYGVLVGITQLNPKTVLAYSSVSQMGFVVAVIGMGLAAGDDATPMAAAFYATHHLLVKGSLFLAVGVVALTGRRHLWPMLIPAAVIALGLGGLPLTGGSLAKYAAKDLLGNGLAGTVAVVSSIASTLLMIHFTRRLGESCASHADARAPGALVFAWITMALASLVIPWLLYVDFPIEELPKALAPAALWDALWPVLVGAVLAFLLHRLRSVPRIPAGDVGSALGGLKGVALAAGAGLEHTDTFLRRWAVACVVMLVVSLLFVWALL
ncbi:MAG: hypothetical protein J7605_09215 [Variovorax sp.]|nr:hypothetical protein [Variovorax sp.]